MKMTKKNTYDIAIIGGGPAGLTAAIYALRDNKSVILFEKNIEGGQALSAKRIDNIPGFYGISGQSFVNSVLNQIQSIVDDGFGSFFLEYSEASKVDVYKKNKTGRVFFISSTNGESFFAKKVIFATGNKHRTLGVPGEENLLGKNIHFCVTCDGPLYTGRDVAVIGGGNSALSEAIELSKYANSVVIIQDLPYLTAEEGLVIEAKKIANIRILTDCEIQGFSREVGKIEVILCTGEPSKIISEMVDGVFEAIGLVPDNDVAKDVCNIDDKGYIVNIEGCGGVFAAGDCRSKQHRQIVIACADGAEAAIKACKELNN